MFWLSQSEMVSMSIPCRECIVALHLEAAHDEPGTRTQGPVARCTFVAILLFVRQVQVFSFFARLLQICKHFDGMLHCTPYDKMGGVAFSMLSTTIFLFSSPWASDIILLPDCCKCIHEHAIPARPTVNADMYPTVCT